MHLQLQTYTYRTTSFPREIPQYQEERKTSDLFVMKLLLIFIFLHIAYHFLVCSFFLRIRIFSHNRQIGSDFFLLYLVFFCLLLLLLLSYFSVVVLWRRRLCNERNSAGTYFESKAGIKENRQLEIRNINHLISFFLYNHY